MNYLSTLAIPETNHGKLLTGSHENVRYLLLPPDSLAEEKTVPPS
jgi:hypothetical protein